MKASGKPEPKLGDAVGSVQGSVATKPLLGSGLAPTVLCRLAIQQGHHAVATKVAVLFRKKQKTHGIHLSH